MTHASVCLGTARLALPAAQRLLGSGTTALPAARATAATLAHAGGPPPGPAGCPGPLRRRPPPGLQQLEAPEPVVGPRARLPAGQPGPQLSAHFHYHAPGRGGEGRERERGRRRGREGASEGDARGAVGTVRDVRNSQRHRTRDGYPQPKQSGADSPGPAKTLNRSSEYPVYRI